MASREDIRRYQANLADERNAAAMYRQLADLEPDAKVAEVYRRLAATEDRHAAAWVDRLREAGVEPPAYRPTWRTRALGWIARRFGVQAVLPSLAAQESAATDGYAGQPEAAGMVASERRHAQLLRQISRTTDRGVEGGLLARMEGRHRAAGGNALRAAVLGASDGLVSNFNLVAGVAGASLAAGDILLTGLAGLLAGAISMALGEWISVQSSRELYQKQIATEAEEIAAAPEEETEELSLIYQARGLDEATARTLAERLMSDPDTALDALARDELGIDPKELGGSATEAAVTSFLLFAVGAIVPVVPYLLAMRGAWAIGVSAALSCLGLFGIGAAITLYTGRGVWGSGLRQVAFGLAAAAATFGIGHLIGVGLGAA